MPKKVFGRRWCVDDRRARKWKSSGEGFEQ